ncbi:hypothetical protein ACFL41_00805 [Gemmatimonadota bacterium]
MRHDLHGRDHHPGAITALTAEGIVKTVMPLKNPIGKFISLPETHQIYGALTLGYPRLRFSKWPERIPARVTWIGGG